MHAHCAPARTLNNLAGGVAGGAVGITPGQAFVFALVASVSMMELGSRIGRGVGPLVRRSLALEPRLVAAAIFVLMALVQLSDLEKVLSLRSSEVLNQL